MHYQNPDAEPQMPLYTPRCKPPKSLRDPNILGLRLRNPHIKPESAAIEPAPYSMMLPFHMRPECAEITSRNAKHAGFFWRPSRVVPPADCMELLFRPSVRDSRSRGKVYSKIRRRSMMRWSVQENGRETGGASHIENW